MFSGIENFVEQILDDQDTLNSNAMTTHQVSLQKSIGVSNLQSEIASSILQRMNVRERAQSFEEEFEQLAEIMAEELEEWIRICHCNN